MPVGRRRKTFFWKKFTIFKVLVFFSIFRQNSSNSQVRLKRISLYGYVPPKCARFPQMYKAFFYLTSLSQSVQPITPIPTNPLNLKQALANRNHINIAMNALRKTVFQYRERFKRLDRKWHLLIGSQLFFGLAAFRYHRQQKRFELQQEATPTTSTENSSS